MDNHVDEGRVRDTGCTRRALGLRKDGEPVPDATMTQLWRNTLEVHAAELDGGNRPLIVEDGSVLTFMAPIG